jgi:hypothetical protein
MEWLASIHSTQVVKFPERPNDELTTWVELNTESCNESHIFTADISISSRGSGRGQQAEGSDISQARSSQTDLKGTGDKVVWHLPGRLPDTSTVRLLSAHGPEDTGNRSSIRLATAVQLLISIIRLMQTKEMGCIGYLESTRRMRHESEDYRRKP